MISLLGSSISRGSVFTILVPIVSIESFRISHNLHEMYCKTLKLIFQTINSPQFVSNSTQKSLSTSVSFSLRYSPSRAPGKKVTSDQRVNENDRQSCLL